MTPEHMAKMKAGRAEKKRARELANSIATYGDMRGSKQAQAEAITQAANKLSTDSPEVFAPPAVINVANLPRAPKAPKMTQPELFPTKETDMPTENDTKKVGAWFDSIVSDPNTLAAFKEVFPSRIASLRAEAKEAYDTATARLNGIAEALGNLVSLEEETPAPATVAKPKRAYTKRATTEGAAPKPAKAKGATSALQAPPNPASEKAVLAVLTNRFQSCAEIAAKLGAGFSPADVKPAADKLVASNKAKKEQGKRGPYPSIAKV